jgi:hypothetical protein
VVVVVVSIVLLAVVVSSKDRRSGQKEAHYDGRKDPAGTEKRVQPSGLAVRLFPTIRLGQGFWYPHDDLSTVNSRCLKEAGVKTGYTMEGAKFSFFGR